MTSPHISPGIAFLAKIQTCMSAGLEPKPWLFHGFGEDQAQARLGESGT